LVHGGPGGTAFPPGGPFPAPYTQPNSQVHQVQGLAPQIMYEHKGTAQVHLLTTDWVEIWVQSTNDATATGTIFSGMINLVPLL